MNYCTLSDIQKRAPDDVLMALTDDESNDVIDAARVDGAIADAGAEIDSLLQSRYTVPFVEPVPTIIRTICETLAVMKLIDRKPESVPEPFRDGWKKTFDAHWNMLMKVASGALSIGTPEPGHAAPMRVKAPCKDRDHRFRKRY